MASWSYDKETGRTTIIPTAHEILNSLADMPAWSKTLYDHTDAAYKVLLALIIENNFYRREQKKTMGAIAKITGIDQGKLKKWLVKIYDDLIALNYEQPALFKSPGIRHLLVMTNMRNECQLNVWLPSTPRKGDEIEIYLMKAKLDCYLYTVTRITYEITNNETHITLSLEGGTRNPYRDWLLHRAWFEQRIGYNFKRDLTELEMDELLRKLYK